MGDIIKKIKICGLRGKLFKPVYPARDWPEVKALVDTGSTASVITRALADLAGAEVVPGMRTHQGRACDAALMKLHLPGCRPSTHVVIVDDRLAANAEPEAHMILGHDYLQDNRARIDYASGELVSCPSVRKQRSASKIKRKLARK